MTGDSSVLLRTEELRVRDPSDPIDIAVLAGSMLVLLGGPDTIAPGLASMVAGADNPVSGRVLLGENLIDVRSREGRKLVRMVSSPPGSQGKLTVAGHMGLSAAAAGLSRRESGDIISHLASWSGLDRLMDRPVEELDRDDRYILGFASACLPMPMVMVLQGPIPTRMHHLLSDLCDNGCAILVSVTGVAHVPRNAERVALCSPTGIPIILRLQELTDACTVLRRISVRFLPALPRVVMESLSGARDFLAIDGGYSFHHGNLSTAVTNLVNLARANSRTIVGLEMIPPPLDVILDHFAPEADEYGVDLFCPEDLDT